ncbi:MAG: amidohydrolase [Gemmatimonadales bacterium]|jgi:imidazolonepropionase-like amidohydrolase
MRSLSRPIVVAVLTSACFSGNTTPGVPPAVPVQYPSTYVRLPAPPVLIRNATILTAAGPELPHASILFAEGKVVSVGTESIAAPADAVVVDGTGRFVTPGLIDTHSHLGVYSAPGTESQSDGNEATDPVTAQVWAEHSFWPQDPQIPLAIAGGITVIEVLPGSANLIGGRSVTLRLIPARTVQEMKFPGAPYALKMACGENPKSVYQEKGPSTRMGNVAGYRQAFADAQEYVRKWKDFEEKGKDQPKRDLKLETLADVMAGKILVQNHCYRADEMAQMLDLAREFGFHIRSFHHAVEAYKIADMLARDSVSASVWSDWWGFKMESLDGIPENAAMITHAGARVNIHSDSEDGIQRLNQDAARAMWAGNHAGIPVTREQAIRWITANPAWTLGIDSITGTLEKGKAADVVLWSGDPFSVYSKADQVWNDGRLVFDRSDPKKQYRTDFNLGTGAPGVGQ